MLRIEGYNKTYNDLRLGDPTWHSQNKEDTRNEKMKLIRRKTLMDRESAENV